MGPVQEDQKRKGERRKNVPAFNSVPAGGEEWHLYIARLSVILGSGLGS